MAGTGDPSKHKYKKVAVLNKKTGKYEMKFQEKSALKTKYKKVGNKWSRITPAKAKGKAKFPGAKTYKDNQGVVRLVGSGLAKSNLDRQVDAAILKETGPLSQAIQQANKEFQQGRGSVNSASDATNMELGKIAGNIERLGSDQLGRAAAASGGTSAAQQESLNFLKSILGGSVQDPEALNEAGDLGGALAASELSAGATQSALNSQASLAESRGMMQSGAMRSKEDVNKLRLSRDAKRDDYSSSIRTAKQSRDELTRQYRRENLDARLAKQQMKLSKQQFAWDKDMQQQQLDSQNAQNAAGNSLSQQQLDAAKGGKAGDKGAYGFGVDVDELIAREAHKFRSLSNDKKTISRLFTYLLRGTSLNPNQVAKLSRSNFASVIRKSGWKSYGDTLIKNGVSRAAAKTHIKAVFGASGVNQWNSYQSQTDGTRDHTYGSGSSSSSSGSGSADKDYLADQWNQYGNPANYYSGK